MELQEFLLIIRDTCDDLLTKSRQVETHTKLEMDVLGAIRQALLHIRVIKDIGDKALTHIEK